MTVIPSLRFLKSYLIVIEYFSLCPCQVNNLNSYNFLNYLFWFFYCSRVWHLMFCWVSSMIAMCLLTINEVAYSLFDVGCVTHEQ